MLFRATRSNVKRLMYDFLFDIPSAKPKRIARPARFVGFRRHKSVRRRKFSSIRFSKCCCRMLLILFYASLLWKVQLAWTIPRKDRNRFAHVVHGNGGKGSSKSGRKGAIRPTPRDVPFSTDPTNIPDNQDLLEQIKAVLPEAAVVRAQSTLDPSEWDAPIAHPQRLNNKGGMHRFGAKSLVTLGFATCRLHGNSNCSIDVAASDGFGTQRFPSTPGPLWDFCTHG